MAGQAPLLTQKTPMSGTNRSESPRHSRPLSVTGEIALHARISIKSIPADFLKKKDLQGSPSNQTGRCRPEQKKAPAAPFSIVSLALLAKFKQDPEGQSIPVATVQADEFIRSIDLNGIGDIDSDNRADIKAPVVAIVNAHSITDV